MGTDAVDELLNRIEAIFDCRAARPSELARHLKVRPQRISEWVRQREWRPGGLAALSMLGWAAKVSNRISASGPEMQNNYRSCYVSICDKRKRKEPNDTGAAVYFKLRDKDCVLACDNWNTVGDNLWAIAKHIEALRAQERWGVGTFEQAFAGYARLNEKTESTCWEVLGITAHSPESQILDAYRRKARETHPDSGGSAESFSAIVRAKDIALGLIKNERKAA